MEKLLNIYENDGINCMVFNLNFHSKDKIYFLLIFVHLSYFRNKNMSYYW